MLCGIGGVLGAGLSNLAGNIAAAQRQSAMQKFAMEQLRRQYEELREGGKDLAPRITSHYIDEHGNRKTYDVLPA